MVKRISILLLSIISEPFYHYKELKKENPVTWMMDNLKKLWGENVQKEVRFPIFMKMGVVRK